MNTTIQINTILKMLLPLSQDNKKWLADRLYADIQASSKTGRMKVRLNELAKLEAGWDGNNAQPVSPQACYNMEAILASCNEEDIENWILFPDVNGNLYLDLKSEDIDAGIILSGNTFSFFTDEKDEKDIPFTPDIFLSVIRSINCLTP